MELMRPACLIARSPENRKMQQPAHRRPRLQGHMYITTLYIRGCNVPVSARALMTGRTPYRPLLASMQKPFHACRVKLGNARHFEGWVHRVGATQSNLLEACGCSCRCIIQGQQDGAGHGYSAAQPDQTAWPVPRQQGQRRRHQRSHLRCTRSAAPPNT